MSYQAVIGLEVHAQLHTQSKIYCSCPVVADTGDLEPNRYTCPTCLALPGTLPVLNRRAVEVGILVGLALNCTIQPRSVFARKSYFYPDLPKGYQISQYDQPLATDGWLEIELESGSRCIGITRAHLEEDAGKLSHSSEGILVDYNRAGIPLLEIVSEPELHTVAEVKAYAVALRDILIYLGANSGDMEQGMLRFEANVSLRPVGAAELGTRTEIKNLNSFRALTRGVAYELQRQREVLARGGVVAQETLGWDAVQERTYVQRRKEQADDYRYFPEPDIPPLEISAEWVAALRQELPELPLAKKRRFRADYGLRPAEATLLAAVPTWADYFESAVSWGAQSGIEPQEIANWQTGALAHLLHENNAQVQAQLVTPERLVAMLVLLADDAITMTVAKQVLEEVFRTGREPAAIVTELGWEQISDPDALGAVVAKIINESAPEVELYLAGKEALLGWFIGQAMKMTEGKANPHTLKKLFRTALEKQRAR